MVDRERTAPVEALARAFGADAWRLAVVTGADEAAAKRAVLHALVIGAVDGGDAAGRPAILALARSWALSSPGTGSGARGGGPVADAFWALDEPLRAALWCTDRLGLAAADVARVVGSAAAAATVARGRLRRAACRQWRTTLANPGCGAAAGLLGRVVAGHASAAEAATVSEHAATCEGCDRLLVALRDPTSAVESGLPVAPDLVVPAGRAWRDHVGAPRLSLAERTGRMAVAVSSHHRPVAAVLAIVTASSFGAATSQLAASPDPPPPAALAAAPTPVVSLPRAPAPTAVRPQAVIPPLAGEVVLDPGLAHVVTVDLTQLAPAPLLAPPPVAVPPPVAPQPAAVNLIREPPPAVPLPRTLDLAVPPVALELGDCPTITIGPFRLVLACAR